MWAWWCLVIRSHVDQPKTWPKRAVNEAAQNRASVLFNALLLYLPHEKWNKKNKMEQWNTEILIPSLRHPPGADKCGIPAHPHQETRHPFWSFVLLKNNSAPLELSKTEISHRLQVLKPSTATWGSGWEAELDGFRKVGNGHPFPAAASLLSLHTFPPLLPFQPRARAIKRSCKTKHPRNTNCPQLWIRFSRSCNNRVLQKYLYDRLREARLFLSR